MPSLFRPKAKPKGKPTRTSSVWFIRYWCPIRRRSHAISTRCRNRKNAERCLREFCNLLERGEVGLENPFLVRLRQEREKQSSDRREIEACLTAFEVDLRAGRIRKRGRRQAVGEGYADTTMARIRRITTGCGVKTIDQLTVEMVNAFLDRCQANGTIRTNQTRKHHERAIKAFTRWGQTTERLDRDSLSRLDVTYVDEERDVVHTRSEFTLEEMTRIIQAATGAAPLAGLTGRQRALLYAFAASTGFRARECAAIRRQDFTEDFAFVTLSGLFTKNRKRATLPIPPGLREVLAEYAAKLAPDEFLWPCGWKQNEKREWVPDGWIKDGRAGDFLRADAALVGIVIGRKGKEANGGRVLDFHSFRHTYISNLERADVTDGLRGQLSRATAQVVERYTHRELGRLAEVAQRLPTPDLSALKNKPA
ncbi:tyrosine-type recombinase/integrase [Thermogemmata fonticola]|uniref:Tyrosine-type recombinase/integrase n=1 Tax=Thermogemmata fonticola TaxID=2755323 RepID=A0A7V9AA57_9BACT|nr:tyrosine-type recombinase/integrase [Thermogemmata fonticola]MBA2224663.1 tyrosine-type recombinase/integrase [Thermogemmata fonticola]